MKITFDPVKDRGNLSKHGVSLAQAQKVDWDNALVWVDRRWDYGEEREIALAGIGNTLYYVAYVERAECLRIISLRRATNREIAHYVSHIEIRS